MTQVPSYRLKTLGSRDVALVHAMLAMFGEAFGDPETYGPSRPSAAYLERLLASEDFIVIAALSEDEVVGGLVGYVLWKLEQERSEIYIYDLAVAASHRRLGIATALIRELQRIGAARGAHVVFVQADLGDAPAVALYSKLGVREDVLHFDIDVAGRSAER